MPAPAIVCLCMAILHCQQVGSLSTRVKGDGLQTWEGGEDKRTAFQEEELRRKRNLGNNKQKKGNRSEERSPWGQTSFTATDRRDVWVCCVPGALLSTPWKQSNLEVSWQSVTDEPSTSRSVSCSLCCASLLARVLLLQGRLTQGLQRSTLFSSSFLSHSSVFAPPNKGSHVPKSLTRLCPGSAPVHRFGCKVPILFLWHICEILEYASGIRDDTPIPQHYPNPKLPPKKREDRVLCFLS